MKRIDNILSQIDPLLVERVCGLQGELRPGAEHAPASREQLEQHQSQHTYPGALWRFYYAQDLELSDQPWKIDSVDHYRWWIVRLDPGCVFPTHRDTFDHREGRRLWVPLTAPQPGHVFQTDTVCLNDYAVGDVFEFDNHQCEHGSANFGHTARVTLQIVVK